MTSSASTSKTNHSVGANDVVKAALHGVCTHKRRRLQICAPVLATIGLIYIAVGTSQNASLRHHNLKSCEEIQVVRQILYNMSSTHDGVTNVTQVQLNQTERHTFERVDLATHWAQLPYNNSPAMPRLVDRTQRERMIKLFANVHAMFTKYNIEYVMYWGTLLGSYVTHGPLAWDDDLDVMANQEHIETIHRLNDTGVLREHGVAMACRKHHGVLRRPNGTCPFIKLFPLDGKNVGYAWKWPFIDVLAFVVNKTRVTVIDDPKHPVIIPREHFHPLVQRPFGPLWLPAPYDSYEALRAQFKHRGYGKGAEFTCERSHWNHFSEKGQKRLKVACSSLVPYYPFVCRDKIDNGVRETLLLNGSPVYSVDIQQPFHEQKYPYELKWK